MTAGRPRLAAFLCARGRAAPVVAAVVAVGVLAIPGAAPLAARLTGQAALNPPASQTVAGQIPQTPPAPQAPPALTVLSREARRTIPVAIQNDQEFVALDDLAATFQVAVREDPGTVTVSYKGRTIVLNPEQTIASVAGRMISLPARPVRAGGRLLVPVDFIARAIAPIYDTRIDVRRASHLLVLGDLRVPRVTVTSDVQSTGVRLTLDAAPSAASTLSREADHLTIKFDADALDLALPAVSAPGLVAGIRRVDAVTLALDLGPRFSSYRSSSLAVDTGTRLTLELLPAPGEAVAPAPPAVPPAAPTAAVQPPPSELPSFGPPATAIRTVTIDPGHGGSDTGTAGPGGLSEKALTLAVARRVKAALEGRLGLRVLLTREDDRDVPFDARAAVANNNKADLFISLHANASFRPEVTGLSIAVAALPDETEARQALAPQRVPVVGGGTRDIELVLWNQAQIRYLDQSTVFANTLLAQLQTKVPLDLRAIDRAPLRILSSANMPAVAVELGFLSNPDQEKQLAGGEFQSAFAQAVVDAVVAFRDYLEHGAEPPR